MFPKRVVAICTVTLSTLIASTLVEAPAYAQEVIDLDEEEGQAKPGSKGVDIDLDEDKPTGAVAVSAGQMTAAAAQAKKLFDRERWSEAALALHRVVSGETGDDPGNKQLAQYYLAISLYRLKFFQTSYSQFAAIADNPSHLKFKETLLWLAKLATQLPEPADIIERVGKYNDQDLARFDNSQQRDLYWQLNYMLGRYKYRNRQYEEAIRLFQRVDRESVYYVKSQFFAGISYVQLRKSVPAIKSFQRIEAALDEGVEGVEDEDRMRDLAHLSMARTYYSSSVKLDAETNAPTVDAKKLSLAVKQWDHVAVSSEYWLDALFEESWAFFMAGQYPKALGNIHTIKSPYFPKAFHPEADILKAVIYFTNCDYQKAIVTVARFMETNTPIKEKLLGVLKRFKGANQEDAFFKFLDSVRTGKADLDPVIKPIVEAALSDRQLLRNLDYVHVLDDESKRYKKAPPAFQSSALGSQIEDALHSARELAVRQAGQLAASRYQRNIDELEEHMRNGEKILIDITSAQRNLLDEKLKSGQVSKAEAKIFGIVSPDEEHILWPFDGEFWRDELGFYRQVVESACGR